MPSPALDLVTARRWAITARLMLASARERIDALNVFPVADGDTGTNMYLTMNGALDYVRSQFELGAGTERLKDGLALISRGMLLSARGNSGIILAQLTRGLAEAVDPEVEQAGATDVAEAFETAARTAWDALASPVEGTILTVARAAAEGARAAVELGAVELGAVERAEVERRGGQPGGQDDGLAARGAPEPGPAGPAVLDVVTAALESAQEALARTPEQLPVLAASGVVDAGGAGLVLVVEALQTVLQDRPPGAAQELPDWWVLTTSPATGRPAPDGPAPHQLTAGAGCAVLSGAGTGEHGADGALEVMYLLTGSDPERAARLRTNLARAGSSVVVAGGPEEFRVHVHLDDPRAAVEAGSLAGLVTEVTVTSLTDGVQLPGPHAGSELPERPGGAAALAVVACGLGRGVAELFTGAGATVVSSGPRQRASAGQLLAAVLACRALRVVVLPNDADTVMVAHAAAAEARELRVEVDVVPTRSLVEGIAALAVHDPGGDPDTVVAGMREAAGGVRSGAVTRADRPAHTPVGPCAAGQWLGIAGDEGIIAVGDDAEAVVRAVVDLLWHDEAEVVTVLLGQGAEEEIGPAVHRVLGERGAAEPAGKPGAADPTGEPGAAGPAGEPGTAAGPVTGRHTVEVVTLQGDQPTYPVLLGVE